MHITNPYLRLMRLHQPVGIWLLLWPCWWSIALARGSDVMVYVLFALGAVVMRAAGCIINDICDRKYDAQVERTKTRPLASGEISLRQAILLLILLLLIGFFIALVLGKGVVLWALASLPLVALYPLMKRITWWPQLFLGITFNWGVFVGWAAAAGVPTIQTVMLYVACVFWTLGYDTIYAHQDKEDDAKIGVKSTARKLGSFTKPFVFSCYAIFAMVFFALLQPEKWALFFMICMGLHLVWQVAKVRLDMPSSCKKTFMTNAPMGVLPWLSILSSYYII